MFLSPPFGVPAFDVFSHTSHYFQVSDDMHWVRNVFYPRTKHQFNVFLAGTGDPESRHAIGVDLALMARSNHTILSYGTYSFWYAYNYYTFKLD